MVKKGDTLVEVTLAVGIFSMVAVAVVAIMSNGTSETQTALETTLTREEIDTQAEALRFIQSSAAAEDPAGSNKPYSELWKSIKGTTLSSTDLNELGLKDPIYQFSPSDCADLYDESKNEYIGKQNAFFIVPSKLKASNSSDALVTYDKKYFSHAETYPHLEIGADRAVAKGIYVVGVNVDNYYDFYIRTCWYGANADKLSTISTVIRLLDT